MNCYSNYNKTKLNKPYAYFMRCTASAEEDNLSPFDSNNIACARVSNLTTTNMYIARARCENQLAVGSSGLNARWPQGRADELKF